MAYEILRKPYDEVRSEFIRNEIRQGSFEDVEYRRYVNRLVWLEWYTVDRVPATGSGIGAFGSSIHRLQIAAAFPDAYDAVRRELGESTRAEESWESSRNGDIEKRQCRSRRHAEEWRAVQRGEQRPPEARSELTEADRRDVSIIQFPPMPYDSIQSPFVREEIERGSFDNLPHRQTVNKFAWIEWDAVVSEGGTFGDVSTRWHIVAEYLAEVNIIRCELGEDRIKPRDKFSVPSKSHSEITALGRERKRAWQAVQES